MMDGILVGGYYNGNTTRIPLMVVSYKRLLYNYLDTKLHTYLDTKLHTKVDPRYVTGMECVGPEMLVFWSEEE